MSIGANVDNTVVIMENGALHDKQTLRFPNEFIAHKALDLIGDISILGAEIVGKITAVNPSHKLNHMILRKVWN
jgi:UDP-3-O-[3-hydroxymyristoyl] N-acetylglucosamine deacetylase